MKIPAQPGLSLLDAPLAVRHLLDGVTLSLLDRDEDWALGYFALLRTYQPSPEGRLRLRFTTSAFTIVPPVTDSDQPQVRRLDTTALTDVATVQAAVQAMGHTVDPHTRTPVDRLLWFRIDRHNDAPWQATSVTLDHSPISTRWADLDMQDVAGDIVEDFDFVAAVDRAVLPHVTEPSLG